MNTELSQKVTGVITEHKTLLDMSTEDEAVREVEVSSHCQGTAIDEGIICSDCSTVFQYMFAPVDRLISGECGHSTVEVESLRVVADDVEIVANFAGELSNGNATFLAVGLIDLEIFATERPSVGVVAFDDLVEHSDIIAAVAGLSSKETVYHIGTDFNC